MPVLRGRVSSISSRDEVTGETLANIAPEGPNPRRLSYPFLGTFAHAFFAGESIEITGEWEMHLRLGQVFRVTRIERRPPTTRDGEIIFLAGYIKGLSKAQARLLLEKFGSLAALIDVCRTRPQELDAVLPKARQARRRLINAQWDRREIDVDVFVALQSAGLRHTQIQELVRFFGAGSLRTMAQATPYQFCQVPKIGFASAEKVATFYAEAQGRRIDLLNEERLVYGLLDVVGRERQHGHICASEERILMVGVRHLGLPRTSAAKTALRDALGTALKRRLLIKEFDMIYPRGLHRAESELALHIGKLLAGGARPLFQTPAAIVRELKDSGLSDEQKQAVATVGTSPVSLLTGGPGRGKTRTLSSFVDLLDKHRRSYMILAPTGKAAKRAAEMTGKPCFTIHKACGLDREEDINDKKYGRKLGRRDRFNVDVIIVDESSMIDLALGFELTRRVKPGRTAIVFVGDPDQLPPVSAGQVLKDLIASGVIPQAKLTQVFRQANGSMIVDGADALNSGNVPTFAETGHEVRLFDPSTAKNHPGSDDPDAAADFEVRLLATWIAQAIQRYARDQQLNPLRDIQVYAPQRNGPLGLETLNQQLQALLNPTARTRNQGTIKIEGGYAVQVGDKVMQIRNNYRMRFAGAATAARATVGRGGKHRAAPTPEAQKEYVPVMNGQVGFVTRVDPARMEIEVQFDDMADPVLYLRSDEWRQLAPAYAMSIHRSQGSETPFAFIVLHDSMNQKLVNRALIYTAWTRAKRGVALFANRSAVARAAKNLDGTVRHSNLHRRLSQIAASPTRKRIQMFPAAGAQTSGVPATAASGAPTANVPTAGPQ